MPYIIECRVNAKERVLRVSDQQGKELQRLQLERKMPEAISLNGETMLASTIQLISPEETWLGYDKKALSAKGHQRCRNCLEVRSFGDNCPCVKLYDPMKQEPEYLKDHEALSPDRMRAGWIRALSAAKAVTPHWQKYAGSMMERYLIAPEEIR